MIKTVVTSVFILCAGGCILTAVIANEDRKILIKELNKPYSDTPLYFKKYVRESIVYKSKHKH